jgi:hypothetical protein
MAEILDWQGKMLTDDQVKQIADTLQSIRFNIGVIKGIAGLIRTLSEERVVDSDLRLILHKAAVIDEETLRISTLLCQQVAGNR